MNKCPICGKNQINKATLKCALQLFRAKFDIISEGYNPGGYSFSTGYKHFHISAMCDHCDGLKLLSFVKENEIVGYAK